MKQDTTLYLRKVPVEIKQKLEIIAKENGYNNLSEFLRSQLKQLAAQGSPIGSVEPVQLQLGRLEATLDSLTLAINNNNKIYAEDKQLLINLLG